MTRQISKSKYTINKYKTIEKTDKRQKIMHKIMIYKEIKKVKQIK